MSLHGIALAQTPAQPWRNGGGHTRELLAWPQAQDWSVRVSVADIAADGPFSAFAGVQRWFAVLQGEGVCLHLGGPPASVRLGQPPLHFDGALAPHCTLLDGATRDLNLMGRASQGTVRMADAATAAHWPAGPRWRALYTTLDQRLRHGAGSTPVAAHSLVWSDDANEDWSLAQPPWPGQSWWMRFDLRSAA